jgi:hypothetical protein
LTSAPLELLKAAHTAPSADNSQPWRFVWDGSGLELVYGGDSSPNTLFGAMSPATLLAIGCVIENLFAAAQGYGYCLTPVGEFEPAYEDGRYLRIMVEGLEESPRDRAAVRAVLGRHTNRFPYRPDPLPIELQDMICELSEPPARLMCFGHPEERAAIARLVVTASGIRFRTRVLHEWLASSLRYTPREVAAGDGLDVRTLDLPPGGRAFLRFIGHWRRMEMMNRIGAYRAMAAIEARPIRHGPMLVAVIAPRDAPACVAVGRLMTRVWTLLNAEGVAVHPYYGIPDQLQRLRDGTVPGHLLQGAKTLTKDCVRFFGLDSDETLHMLLRVGRPRRDPTRSRRRPLASVLTDLSSQ